MHAYKCHQSWHIIIHIFRLRIYASHAHSQTTSPIRIFTTLSHTNHTLSRPLLFTRSSPGIFPTAYPSTLSSKTMSLLVIFSIVYRQTYHRLLIAFLGNHIYLYLAVISDRRTSIIGFVIGTFRRAVDINPSIVSNRSIYTVFDKLTTELHSHK